MNRIQRFSLTLLLVAAGLPLSAQQQKVTVKVKEAPVAEVLKGIERQTRLAFFYNNADLDDGRTVTVQAEDTPVQEVLEKMLPDFTFRFDNKKVILTRKPVPVRQQRTPQEPVRLSGSIKDAAGEPLPGASAIVTVNGRKYGATTDLDGAFTLDLPVRLEGTETLTASFLGFDDVTLPIGNRSRFDIVLEESNRVLDESVVVGYGTQKKVNLTGAVAAISAEEIRNRPVATVGQALQGVIPNLNITQTSGQPGAGSSYNIRGNTSPNGGSPLILVDGVETYLERINSNDIESISVLKDASSAAIYGARGAFGVILVTTKSGKADTPARVTADARFSVSANTMSTDFETRGYYSARIADLFISTSQGVPYTNYTEYDYQRLWERRNDKVENPERPWVLTEMRNGKMSYVYLANFDWYNYLFDETRPTQDYNVSVSGGSKTVSYLVSGRFYTQQGINRQLPDRFSSFNTRAKVSVKVKPWLTLTNNTKFFNSGYNYYGYSSETDNFRKPTLHALASFVPVNPDGTAVSHTSMTASSAHYLMDGYNAMLQKGKAGGNNRTTELTSTFEAQARITDFLQFKADYSYKFGYLRNGYRSTTVEYSQYPGEILQESASSFEDYLSDVVYEQNNHTANAWFLFDRTWKESHHVTATAGANYESRHYKDLKVQRKDLLSEDLSDFNLASGDLKALTGGISEYAIMGLFYRLTYDYKSRYLLELDGRYDGSSRFPAGHRWGAFPSASAAWRISEESFWAPLKEVWNQAKVRASYGSLGNQDIGYYDFYQTVNTKGTMSYSFDGKTLAGHAVVDAPVSSGTWEKIESKDIGLDLGFLQDRLTFSTDFYIRDTKGILTTGKKLPSLYGASEPTVNANDMRTRGYEVQFEWKDSFKLAGRPFHYNVGASLADYTAWYTRCDNPSGLIGEPYEGKRLGEIWGFRVDGLFRNDEEAAEYASRVNMEQVCKNYYNSVGEYGKGVRGGDMRYLDLDGDGEVTFGQGTLEDHGDREIIGNSQPRYSYGFHFGFDWNGFDLAVFFQGIGHMDWYPGNDNQRFWGPYSRPYTTFVPRDFMADVWSEDNPDAYFPRARGYAALNSSNGSLYYTNDRYLQNLAYLRLKNLTFGWSFPEKWVRRAGLSSARLYFSGENLWCWSAIHSRFVDPEQVAVASNKAGNTYTWYKTFSFGLNLEF